ncbi:MAG: hypothetical protein AAF598_04215 [Bacteroidota bacterium]
MKRFSFYAWIFVSLFILGVGFFGYPKWKKAQTEATISWDVAGYYWYLPATLIYQDIKKLEFRDSIIQTYMPIPRFDQGFPHGPDQNLVLKYPIGISILYSPAFLVGHLIAKNSSYPADGYSAPYQFMLSLWSMIVAILGLYVLRKVLRIYFNDQSVGLFLILLAIGTNYLNYAAIDAAMTHGYLFTIYALVTYLTHQFYLSKSWWVAGLIGVFIGLAALTRPTEVLVALIPLLWGVGSFTAFKERVKFISKNFGYYFLMGFLTGLIGFIQLAYWKYVSGAWFVYSYQDQGFSWLHPHILNGLFSYRKGWLIYTPMMLFAIAGFYWLWKKDRSLVVPIITFILPAFYIVFAWDIWWYGGSLGQRAVIQSYVFLAFPFCAFLEALLKWKTGLKVTIGGVFLFFMYYNLWITYQAHGGGLWDPEATTKAFFLKNFLKYKMEPSTLKLLDTEDEYLGERQNIRLLYKNDFEADTSGRVCEIEPITGQGAVCVTQDQQLSMEYEFPIPEDAGDWIRVTADIRCHAKEWEAWRMAMLVLHQYEGEERKETNGIRVYRLMGDNDTQTLFIDVKVAKKEKVNRGAVVLWNRNSQKSTLMDNLRVETYDPE